MPETANTELIPLETLRTVFPRICVLAPKDNEPHRFGYVLCRTLEKMGFRVEMIPFRNRIRELAERVPQVEADLVIVLRGDGIPPQIIRSFRCPTVLWYLEYLHGADEHSNARHRELKQNAPAFDYVFYGANDAESIRILKRLGCSRVGHVYPNRFDPAIYRKLDIDKAYDVTFVGTLSPRRKHILATLGKQFKVDYKSIWDIDEQVRFFNQSRIVLHINSFDFLGGSFVNLRVFDVLGCGSFMLTEDQVVHDQFKDGEHLAYWNYGDADDLVSKVRFYLENEEARETIARQGHQYINDNFSAEKSLIELLSKVDLNLRAGRIDRGSWSLGTDKWGRATESIGDWRHFAELWTDSDCPLSYLERGRIYMNIGQWDKVAEMMEKALELDAFLTRAMYPLGLAYKNLGRSREAARELNRLLQMEPFNAGANLALGEVLAELGQSDRAQYYSTKGRKLAGSRPHA